MIYVCTIHTKDSKKGKSSDFDLDISPIDTIKLKQFALAYNALTGGYAKITEMKPVVYTDDKPVFEATVYDSLKVLFNSTSKSMQNISLPYVKRTTSRTELNNFLMLYINDYKSTVNVLEKKSI